MTPANLLLIGTTKERT